jgi:hypothetical protein
VLEPDATMVQHAQAANAGLLKNFPKGYPLGDQHAPHISVIGGYFHTEKPSALSSMRCRLANVPLSANYPQRDYRAPVTTDSGGVSFR